MAGSNSFPTHTPPLAFTPDAESSPSNAPSQHDFVQIAPSTASLASSTTTTHGPSLINSPTVLSQNGLGQPAIGQPLPQIPGATVYTPTAIPGIELNPRSCVTCRRRKVRCDKHMPCSNCRRALIPCIFPAPERAPRRPRRKDPNALRPHQSTEREIELLKRLRKLEGIVEELSGQVELEATKQHSSNGGSPEAINGSQVSIASGLNNNGSCADVAGSAGNNGNGISNGNGNGNINGNSYGPGSVRGQQSPMLGNVPAGGSPGRLISDNNGKIKGGKDAERQFGRLVINDHGRSRYVSSAFWSKISDELDELRSEAQRISEPDTEASETESSPPHDTDERPEADHHAFCFGFQSTTVDLRPLHPLPSQIPYIWQVYLENVDPVVKVLHTISTSKLIRNARTNLDDISPAAEALMFAIYYAAVTSLDENEIKINFMAEKEALVNKYRFALEQALAKAQFLVSADLVVLQAFVIYIVLIRRNDETRLAWTMTGLAIRISHSIGLHRDGSNFPSLSPFEVEMRRRLFWAICIIDMRSAEDLGTDLSILEHGFDTQLPLNINDSDISPDSTSLPPARKGATDITFALIRYEILSVVRRMHVMQSGGIGSIYPVDSTTSLEERERMIHDIYEHIQEKYLGSSESSSDPIFWVAGIIARVICTRMTLAVYQPILFPTGGNEDMSRELRDRLFTGSTELFEYTTMLTTDPRTKQWRWLFKTYMQWHAVAYILMEESRRPWSASVERSWQAVSLIITGPKSQEVDRMTANASIWLPFKMLYNKARKHRDAEIERLRGDRREVIRLDREDHVRLGPTIFSAAEGGIDGYHWREQWLQLVGAPELAAESPAPPSTADGSVAESADGASTEKGDQSDRQLQPQEQQQQQQPQQQQLQLLQRPLPQHLHQQQNQQQQQQQQLPVSTEVAANNILDRVFAQPTFESSDLFPVYMSEELVKTLPEGNVYGNFGNADLTRQDPALAHFGTNAPFSGGLGAGHGGSSSSSSLPTTSSSQQPNTTSLVDGMVKDYPPWLWPTSNQAASQQLQHQQLQQQQQQQQQQLQQQQHQQFPGLLVDEDITMDDNFDWQDFGQNLGGMPNGVWSSQGL